MRTEYLLKTKNKTIGPTIKKLKKTSIIYASEESFKEKHSSIILYYRKKDEKTLFENNVKNIQSLTIISLKAMSANQRNNDEVFIAFGHDKAPMRELKKYLRQLNIDPKIIGDSDPGTNIILEDLQKFSEKGKCAFIILTPDDSCKFDKKSKKRARQNVVFEYGLFLGRLPREHITPFHKGKFDTMERPTDTDGVIMYEFEKNIMERERVILETLEESKVKMTKLL